MAAECAVTPEFASAYRDMMLEGLANEAQTTRKVLSAIPDGKKDYRPDPNGRTAWELGWHLANTDVQFLDGIADGKFNMESPDEEHKPKTVAELAAWYEENMARASARVRALTAEQLVSGALATYLRPMGAKCPSIYGGSYDEPWEGAEASSAA